MKSTQTILNPWNGEPVSSLPLCTPQDIEQALAAGAAAVRPFARTSRFLRAELLDAMLQGLHAQKDRLVASICAEAGKPVDLAEGEFARCANTFKVARDEVGRFVGETYAMDLDAGGRAFATATTEFVPRGLIYAITPFNFPLNLVAHKVAPALAVGAPILLKPAPQAPGAAFILLEFFAQAVAAVNTRHGTATDRIPEAAYQVIFCDNDLAGIPTRDPRVAIVSFTGSPTVGWSLQKEAARKKLLLELGGNAGVILAGDGDADLCAARCAYGATAYAGQTCISVQRIFAEASLYPAFKQKLIQAFAAIRSGNPSTKGILNGPVINTAARERILDWIQEALDAGATLLCGGTHEGNLIAPTLLENVPDTCKLFAEEVFGPVAILESVPDVPAAIARVNQSKYGLHAGIFTRDIGTVQRAFKELEVGGVLVNEVPTFRADHMPYGGMKESGLGREGVRYAMEDFCERKTLVQKSV